MAKHKGPPKKLPTFISFSSQVNEKTAQALLDLCVDLANKKTDTVTLLLSIPGGTVRDGITLHNMLRTLPFKLITYNVGSVDSIGNVVFLAGEQRYAVPSATFMFHGVGLNIRNAGRLEEKMLREKLEGIRADHKKIAAIYNERASIEDGEVGKLFLEAATKDAAYAKERGIIHDIRQVQIPRGAPLVRMKAQ